MPLSLLNSDVQMHIFTTFWTSIPFAARCRSITAHATCYYPTPQETLWKKHCARRWNWLDLDASNNKQSTNVVLQDALELPTAAGISPFCNLSLLLSLASKNVSSHVDESIFMPCRWSRSGKSPAGYEYRASILKTVTTETVNRPCSLSDGGQGDLFERQPALGSLVPICTATVIIVRRKDRHSGSAR
jgi:hypothetical protein